MPGIEVHREPDITWMLSNGVVRSNSGTMLRFAPHTARKRLDQLQKRFARHGRGIGFWVDQDATPSDLADHLEGLKLHCRNRFSGMWCDLSKTPAIPAPAGVRIIQTPHHSMYLRHAHPYFGKINTPVRRHELNRLAHMAAQWPDRFFDFVALAAGNRPVGACSMFLSGSPEKFVAGFHDAGVLEAERRKGIGTALLIHALHIAQARGATQAVLLSSGLGKEMARAAGFQEVCKVSYWYKALKA